MPSQDIAAIVQNDRAEWRHCISLSPIQVVDGIDITTSSFRTDLITTRPLASHRSRQSHMERVIDPFSSFSQGLKGRVRAHHRRGTRQGSSPIGLRPGPDDYGDLKPAPGPRCSVVNPCSALPRVGEGPRLGICGWYRQVISSLRPLAVGISGGLSCWRKYVTAPIGGIAGRRYRMACNAFVDSSHAWD
jgi:hypothetical protein